MTDHKSPFDHLLDLTVYVPVGLAMAAREQLPRLAEKGRQQVTGQVTLARMIGRFAVSQGQREANKVRQQAADALTNLFMARDGSSGGVPPGEATVAPTRWTASNGRTSSQQSPVPSATLAIPGYDSLSASQVVQRLAGLAPDELEEVRKYETATRGRRTVLSKIAQLQSPPL